MNRLGGGGLWDEEDGFFYDRLRMPDGRKIPMQVRSLVGLIPLFAVATLDAEAIDRMPGFKRRMMWFIKHRAGPVLQHRVHYAAGPERAHAAFPGATFAPAARSANHAG